MKQEIDFILKSATESGQIAGVVATAATENGVIYEGAFGIRELSEVAAMTTNTVGYIASMTKALTGAAAMQLAERGKLKLDSPAAIIVPTLADVKVLSGFDSNGQPILRSPKRPITLRHLLTHTSGFGYEIWSPDILRYNEATGTPSIFTSKNGALTAPLLCDPGEGWVYGIGIDWVGKMVEAVSGQDLGTFFKENLFEPLGMKSTVFKLTPEIRTRLASMHTRQPDGTLKVYRWEFDQNPEFLQGGGGLYSTMPDYLRFTQMILHRGKFNGHQILKPETVDMMSQNQIGEVCCNDLKTSLPFYSNDANFYPNMKQKWGLSFLINTEAGHAGRSAGSLAWAGLNNTYYWLDPVKKIAGVFMTQTLPFADYTVLEALDSFERAVYQSVG